VARNTVQRRAIRRALFEADRPLTPREVLDGAQAEAPGLGIATVYRTVKDLREEGWLTTVELPGEPARFELSDKAHHHHFSCRNCGRVFELAGCPGDLKQLLPKGFSMEDHEVVLYGACRECNT
jgi:Fur family transcriptional regulator, ferric uptake regulator